ncbi:hypothetical protein LDVICp082 [lymphocystis disease virus-China]|uniref:Uncharacterized protein n=2 Tax=Lymphocystis disease virus 2 TaxID=159183 RepID=A0A6F8X1L2_9VIRU|nr:hypothetical protein LDVICp082 [lymphocystis disease virus-China]AAU10928.1 hypothetical protein [lymphocystis disease virus-China]BCB67460.1 hypothetical protein [Lymphocystis disease virus 2]
MEFYHCEKYQFKQNKIVYKTKSEDFIWPQISFTVLKQYALCEKQNSILISESSILGSKYSIIIKDETDQTTDLEVIVYNHRYIVINTNDQQRILYRNYICYIDKLLDRIKKDYNGVFIKPPKNIEFIKKKLIVT